VIASTIYQQTENSGCSIGLNDSNECPGLHNSFGVAERWGWRCRDNSGFCHYPEDGVPKGWLVRRWDDVSKPAEKAATWRVEDGVLHGSEPRGTWLVSERSTAISFSNLNGSLVTRQQRHRSARAAFWRSGF